MFVRFIAYTSYTATGSLAGQGYAPASQCSTASACIALLKENVADFMPLVREAAAEGDRHFGVVFTSPRSMPRALETIGLYVERLDSFLRERPNADALADQVQWLGSNVQGNRA